MAATGVTGDFALDVQSIAKLKYSARKSPQEGLKQTSQQFEALFLQRMFKQMRAAIPKSGLLHSQQSDMYDSMMDQQWAQTLAKRGIGLADMLTKQLQGHAAGGAAKQAQTAPADATDSVGGIPLAAPQALAKSAPIDNHKSATTGKHDSRIDLSAAQPSVPLIAAGNDAHPLFAVADIESADSATATQSVGRKMLPDYVRGFLDRMDGAADTASRETGLPKRLILAQAALETGWGKHEVTRADGRPSFNVFNVKATGWQGDSTRVSTREFENGRAQREQADFRVYNSYDEAFSDYARLLTQSSRYQPVVNAPTAEAAARQLQACGYATDPKYADKLVSIMSHIPDVAAPANIATPLVGAQASAAAPGGSDDAPAQAFIAAVQNAVAMNQGGLQLADAESDVATPLF